MTRIRKLGALALSAPLAMGFLILGAPLPAQAAASGITSPSSGAVITSGSSVTVTATANLLGSTLYVDPPVGAAVRLAGGGLGAKLSGNVAIGHNGPYKIELTAIGGSSTRTFYVKVPPAAPAGLSAAVSGKKLTVRWNLGLEDDLTGYTVTAAGSSRSIGTSCPGSICSTVFTLPSNASGSMKVGVQARRSTGTGGTVVSGTSRTSVTVVSNAGGAGGTSPNMPNYATPNGNTTPLTPVNPHSGVNLPPVAPDGSTPGFVYPTPPPEVATQNQVTPNSTPVAGVSQMAWGRSLALALILLLCAAHLGTWTRRVRAAQAGFGADGRLRRRGGGKAKVKTAHESIAQAEALAKAGTLTKADILGNAAAAAQSSKAASAGKPKAVAGRSPRVAGNGTGTGKAKAGRAPKVSGTGMATGTGTGKATGAGKATGNGTGAGKATGNGTGKASGTGTAKSGQTPKGTGTGTGKARTGQSPKVGSTGKTQAGQPIRSKNRPTTTSTTGRSTGSGVPSDAMTKVTESENTTTKVTENASSTESTRPDRRATPAAVQPTVAESAARSTQVTEPIQVVAPTQTVAPILPLDRSASAAGATGRDRR